MRYSFEEYTEQERQTINDITRREFADLTPEEVALYAEWTSTVDYLESDAQAKRDALEQETQARIEATRETEKKALDTLELMAQAARAKLEAVRNGK